MKSIAKMHILTRDKEKKWLKIFKFYCRVPEYPYLKSLKDQKFGSRLIDCLGF